MTLKEVLDWAVANNEVDLQALIMYLVFEQEVHTLSDDVDTLDLYFLERHGERMKKLLNEYKRKMSMEYPPRLFEVTTTRGVVVAYAIDETQARAFTISQGYDVKGVSIALDSEEYFLGNKLTTLKEMTRNIKSPNIIGKKGI